MLGIVFFAHGAQKMLGWFGGFGFSGTMRYFTGTMYIPTLVAFPAIAAEFFGGLGLIVGFLNRIATFGIVVNMAVAIATVHQAFGAILRVVFEIAHTEPSIVAVDRGEKHRRPRGRSVRMRPH